MGGDGGEGCSIRVRVYGVGVFLEEVEGEPARN